MQEYARGYVDIQQSKCIQDHMSTRSSIQKRHTISLSLSLSHPRSPLGFRGSPFTNTRSAHTQHTVNRSLFSVCLWVSCVHVCVPFSHRRCLHTCALSLCLSLHSALSSKSFALCRSILPDSRKKRACDNSFVVCGLDLLV